MMMMKGWRRKSKMRRRRWTTEVCAGAGVCREGCKCCKWTRLSAPVLPVEFCAVPLGFPLWMKDLVKAFPGAGPLLRHTGGSAPALRSGETAGTGLCMPGGL